MHHHRNRRNTIRHVAYALAFCGCGALGCERASTTDPEPPGGGQKYVMSYDDFAGTVNPILSAKGCDNLNCHGGGIRGTFQLSPQDDKDPAFDYAQASLQVFPPEPRESPLVTKPLAAECGGVPHTGGAYFFSLDDPEYLAILMWIEEGEYQ